MQVFPTGWTCSPAPKLPDSNHFSSRWQAPGRGLPPLARSAAVVAAPLHRDRALQLEDARLAPARRRLRLGPPAGCFALRALELVAQQPRLEDPEVRAPRIVA